MAGRSDTTGEASPPASTPSLTRPEVVAFLNDLELRHDVLAMRHGDVRIWPLLRMIIGGNLVAHEVAAPPSGFGPQRTAQKAAHLIKGLIGIALQPSLVVRDGLLFHTLNRFREEWNGVLHDRFADPLIEAARTMGMQSAVVERLDGSAVHLPRAVDCPRIDISPALALRASLHWRTNMPNPLSIVGLDALRSDAAAKDKVPSLPYIAAQLHTFDLYLRFHTALLAKAQPRCVLLVCWYGLESMAILHACHTLGIRCVDLQHGVQGPAHYAYGRWTELPTEGFTCMPDVFWCWDEASADNINGWAGPTPIKALVLGDPWAARTISKGTPSIWKDDARTRVLYTAEPMPHLVPPEVLQAIHATRSTCQWVLRTHPGMPEMPARSAALLREEGLDGDVTISPPSSTPLAVALNGCQLHVTQYSSVIMEAAVLGVPSVAIHRNSADLFPEAIASGALRIALTLEELLEQMKSPRKITSTTRDLPPLADRLRSIL